MRVGGFQFQSLLFLLLSSSLHQLASATVVAPFYIQQHETGQIRVIVVYGTKEDDHTIVFCGDAPKPLFAEKNVVHCHRLTPDTFSLQLPVTLEQDKSTGEILAMNFDDTDEKIFIPFSTSLDAKGRLHAVITSDESTAIYNNVTIPYSIEAGRGGKVVATDVDENYDEQEYLLVYRQNRDGSYTLRYDEIWTSNKAFGGGKVFILVMVPSFLACLVCIILKRRKVGKARTNPAPEIIFDELYLNEFS